MAAELGELLSIAARRVLPAVRAKGLGFAFDIDGDRFDVELDPSRVVGATYRILHGLVDLVSDGVLVFEARLRALDDGSCRCTVHAVVGGPLAAASVISLVLNRLDMTEHKPGVHEPLWTRQAHGLCPTTGGRVRFACRAGEGAVFRVEIDVAAAACRPLRRAAGARAWIVDPDAFERGALSSRLQRHGWATTSFDSLDAARRRLVAMPAAHARPCLIVIAPQEDGLPADVSPLERLLPEASLCVHLVASGAWALLSAAQVGLRVAPLSPRDLDDFALMAAGAPTPSGLTRPAPLVGGDRGRMLVVDDMAVNRIVATRFGEVLGFAVDAVESGEAAIDACRAASPDVVLMDLRMPGLDGLETTRRLRELQLQGLLAPFPIIATTGEDEAIRGGCTRAGMSDYLPKPLSLGQLRDTLLRQCTGCRTEAA